MLVKTCTLQRAALDWAVDKCEGENTIIRKKELWIEGGPLDDRDEFYSPSTIWAQGGPIIDRKNICFDRLPDNGHRAFFRDDKGVPYGFMDCWYATKLETAMRCYVASELGDEIDVPDELIEVINRDYPPGAAESANRKRRT